MIEVDKHPLVIKMEELGIKEKYKTKYLCGKTSIFLLSERDKGKDSEYYWYI